jgi:hypothetical protein
VSPQPPWKRPGGSAEPPPEPEPTEPTGPLAPETQLPPPEPVAPAAPETQLPPPQAPTPTATPAGPPDPAKRNLGLLAGGLVAIVLIAVVAVVLLTGGGDDPAPERTAAASPSPAAAASAAPTETAPAATPTPPASVRSLIADQVGPFTLARTDPGRVLLKEGAKEAYALDYRGPAGGFLTHQVADMGSSEASERLRKARVKERVGYGDQLTSEQPYVINDHPVGTVSVTRSGKLTLVTWTNGQLYCNMLAGSPQQAQAFMDAVGY